MKRKPRNPIKGTVRCFLPANPKWREHKQRCERLGIDPHETPMQTKRPPKAKKPKESDFVRFMNSLQCKGPDRPGTPYEKWTKSIRQKMEKKGAWPTGAKEWDMEIIARYLQELQKEFWRTVPKIGKGKRVMVAGVLFRRLSGLEIANRGLYWKHREAIRVCLLAFRQIYVRIRSKGLRLKEKGFLLLPWVRDFTPHAIILSKDYPEQKQYRIYFLQSNVSFASTLPKEDRPLMITPTRIGRLEDKECR